MVLSRPLGGFSYNVSSGMCHKVMLPPFLGHEFTRLTFQISLIVLLLMLSSVCAFAANTGNAELAVSDQYAKGNTLFQQGKFKESIAEYQKVLTDFPSQSEACAKAQMAIGKAYYELKDVKNAHYALRKVTMNYSSSCPVVAAWTQMYLADMYQKEMMYPAAVAAYKELVSKYSSQTDLCIAALNSMAKTQCVRGKIAEGLEALQRIVDEYPVSSRVVSDAMLTRAAICHEKQYYGAALAELQKLGEKYPGDRHVQVSVKLQMARYIEKTDRAKAKQLTEELLDSEIVRGSADFLHDLLEFHRNELGESGIRKVAKQYIEALSTSGHLVRAEFAPVEVAYYFEGDTKKAEKLAAEFLQKYPAHDLAAEACFIRGNCLLSSGDKDGALAAYDMVMTVYKKQPDVPDEHINAALQQSAHILADTGRFDEAVKRLDRTSTRTPEDVAYKWDRIGNVWMRAEEWRKAAKCFKKESETKLIPIEALCRAWYNLGECCHRMGDISSAGECMQWVIDHASESSWARKARGALYLWSSTDKASPSGELVGGL